MVPTKKKKCSQTLDAASKSYNQIKRKRRKDSMERSDTAKLARIELLGLFLRERTPITARQMHMLPSRFATIVGHRTAVCKDLEKVLGGEAVTRASRELLMSGHVSS